MLFSFDGPQLLVSVVLAQCNGQQLTTYTADSSKKKASDLTKAEAGLATLEIKVH